MLLEQPDSQTCSFDFLSFSDSCCTSLEWNGVRGKRGGNIHRTEHHLLLSKIIDKKLFYFSSLAPLSPLPEIHTHFHTHCMTVSVVEFEKLSCSLFVVPRKTHPWHGMNQKKKREKSRKKVESSREREKERGRERKKEKRERKRGRRGKCSPFQFRYDC